jgi:hypothetical protein
VDIRRNPIRRHTTPNLRTPLLIGLDEPLFLPRRHFPAPLLLLTLLGEQRPSIITGDGKPADIIKDKPNAAVGKIGGPTADRRLAQVELEHTQRHRMITRDHIGARLNSTIVIAKHSHFSDLQSVNRRGGQDGIKRRRRKEVTVAALRSRIGCHGLTMKFPNLVTLAQPRQVLMPQAAFPNMRALGVNPMNHPRFSSQPTEFPQVDTGGNRHAAYHGRYIPHRTRRHNSGTP